MNDDRETNTSKDENPPVTTTRKTSRRMIDLKKIETSGVQDHNLRNTKSQQHIPKTPKYNTS